MATIDDLTLEERLQLRHGAERLRLQFAGSFNTETIERFMTDSLDVLLPRARSTMWVPLLAERFARDRLRAMQRLQLPSAGTVPSVLFLCVHNAGRSQMAAGFARHIAEERADIFSGGSEPAESVNRAAVEAMREKGIDIGAELPQPWADEIVRAADVVVTMGCGDACPVYPGKRYVDWDVEDPAGKTVAEVRPIRDDLEQRVRRLLMELGVPERAEARN